MSNINDERIHTVREWVIPKYITRDTSIYVIMLRFRGENSNILVEEMPLYSFWAKGERKTYPVDPKDSDKALSMFTDIVEELKKKVE